MDLGEISSDELTDPAGHVGCRLLEAEGWAAEHVCRTAYRRAYFGELAANESVYFDYLKSEGVTAAVIDVLEARCQSEALVRQIEMLI